MWLPWRQHLIPVYISEWLLLALPICRHIQISCKICRKWLFTCNSFKCSFHGNGVSVKVVLQLKMFSLTASLCVPDFGLVTKSAQFSRNLELRCWTIFQSVWLQPFRSINKRSCCPISNGFVQLSNVDRSDFTSLSSLEILLFWRSLCRQLDVFSSNMSFKFPIKMLLYSATYVILADGRGFQTESFIAKRITGTIVHLVTQT